MLKRPLGILVIVVVIALLQGCSGGEKKPQGGGSKKPEMKIGVAMANAKEDDDKFIKKTMEEQKKQQKVEVLWKDAKNDPMEQAINVDEMIKQKVKAIILQPVDPAEGPSLVRKIMEKKIKVLAIDRLPLETPLDAFITPDYARAGELQGDYLASNVPMGKVILFTGDPAMASSKELRDGFFKKVVQNTKLGVVEVKLPEGADEGVIKQTVSTALLNFKGVKGVVAQDAPLTKAMLELVTKMPEGQTMVTVGLGAGKEAVKALSEGSHDAEVDLRPDLVGLYSLRTAMHLAKKEPLEYDEKIRNDDSDVPVKFIPVRLIKGENLYLLAERWGKLAEGGQGKGGQSKKGKSGQKGGSSGGGSSGSSSGGSSQGQGKEKITKLKVTTKDGKTMEIDIPGEINKIEAEAGGKGGQGGQGGGGQGGGGQSGGGGQ